MSVEDWWIELAYVFHRNTTSHGVYSLEHRIEFECYNEIYFLQDTNELLNSHDVDVFKITVF